MELSKIIIGTMRLGDAVSASALLKKAVDYGFNYMDTAPLYRLDNEEQNSEAWVGQALQLEDYRQRVMVSTKCATGDGGLGLGSFNQSIGFGVRTAEEFSKVFGQSLNRMKLPAIDFYHLWICHTTQQFKEAMKPGGWYEGFLKEKEAGRVKHLGITTHADADTIIEILESGYFETVTLPLNVLNRTRIKAVEYCLKKGIKVIAMNPLGGGFLAADEALKRLAFQYLLSLENVHILVGFNSVAEVEYAKAIQDEFDAKPIKTEDIIEQVTRMIPNDEPRCTSCGYCQPCPQFIDVGAALSYYNLYKYLHLESAKQSFKGIQWNQRFKLDQCTACGQCEKRCPNQLPVREIIKDAKDLLYK